MTSTAISDRVLSGDVRAIARAISLVEDDAGAGRELIGRLYEHTGRAYVIGVTGAPGVGKSTLVDRLVSEARRAGQSVGVLAVDPTSPFSGGAILGDRVRMSTHSHDSGVFVRSMATRGHLGGLSAATSDAALVLDAAGTDIVIIETVGVGQDEVDIVRTADVSIVVLVPGTGDDVQALKAGIMEIADIFVVNKADRDGADQVVHSVTASLSLQTFAEGEWHPPVLKTEAANNVGVDRLWAEVGRFRQHESPHQDRRRKESHESRLRAILAQQLLDHVEKQLPSGAFTREVEAIAARRTDPYSAASALMGQALKL
jgi:LAO/AO transport system kinase